MSSRIRSRAWFFTLDNANISMVAQICNIFGNLEYVFQLEKADSGMIHFQGVVRYKNPVECWPNLKAHWERCRNWRKAIIYCSKVETRIDGPWTNLKNLKFRKTIKDPLRGVKPYVWQKEILEIIKNEPDNRKIFWYYESEGNSGKSTLCKHIVMNYNACLLGGNCKDNFCAIKIFIEKKDMDIVVFDIPRSQFNSISYKTIECVKNGMVFNSKYESGQLIFNSPHVIVMCNFPPDLSKLSRDRWVIKNILK